MNGDLRARVQLGMQLSPHSAGRVGAATAIELAHGAGVSGALWGLEQAERLVVAQMSEQRELVRAYMARPPAVQTYGDLARAQTAQRTLDLLMSMLVELLRVRGTVR